MSAADASSSSSAFDVEGISYFENLLRDARGEVALASLRCTIVFA
jgi:hypothetical protein